MASDSSLFKEGKLQLRYFVLDLEKAMFKFSKNDKSSKFREFPFKNIVKVEVKDYYVATHKDFPFAFIVITQERDFHLCAKSFQDRSMWLNGFNFLFEYRLQQASKL